jgi:glucosamine kinase
MTYYAGIDAGGTGTRALLADDERVLGRGEAGPANPGSIGPQGTAIVLSVAVQAAFEAAGLLPQLDQTVVHAGVAGLGRLADRERVAASSHVFAHLSLESDASLTRRAAFGTSPGTLLIVGTGAIALGQDELGCEQRSGGWGFPLERGGGAWLGLEAIRRGLEGQEGGPSTLLADLVAEEIGQVPQVIEWGRHAKPADYARFAPQVVRLAEQGDAVAQALVDEWIGEIEALLERVTPLVPGPWALWGGLRNLVAPRLSRRWQQQRTALLHEPLETALAVARDIGAHLLARR